MNEIILFLLATVTLFTSARCALVYNIVGCPSNYTLQSMYNQDKLLWSPSNSRCSFLLKNPGYMNTQLSVSVKWGITIGVSSQKLPSPCINATFLFSTTPLRQVCTRKILRQGSCLTLLYRMSPSYKLFWEIWDWNQNDAKLMSISRELEFAYCGNINITMRVFAPNVPLTSYTPQTETVFSVETSWNMGQILMRIVIPAIAVFMVIIILAICIFCLIRRSFFCNHRETNGTGPPYPGMHSTYSEHCNAAFIEDPPNYADIGKYPLTEQYQNQIKSCDNKQCHAGGPSNSKVVKPPAEEKVSVSPRSASPPPSYAHTRRHVDAEGVSLYEVVMDSHDDGLTNATVKENAIPTATDNNPSVKATAPPLDNNEEEYAHL